ncbi:MAG TPA: ADP-glyceromanno-heptose 6-epimerase [Elusimicrobia bacterium]|nr:ADP-glyceromanno-heptose 6-epimerase [Elusimicrobiota bacterium]
MKRALVTGAAGFIGSNLALELERRGWEVVALDDFRSGHFENLEGFGGEVVAGDICRPEEWADRVGPVAAVFHEAAITDTTVSDQKLMMQVNVEGFRDVLRFALKARAKAVVYASSAGVYGAGATPMREAQAPAPMNVYGFSKMVMERTAARFRSEHPGLRVCGLRYFNVFGPREQFKKHAASMIWQLYLQMKAGRRPRIFKFGEQYRDQIYVQDIVAANLRALESGKSGVFNACTGRGTDFNLIVKALNAAMGKRLKPDYIPNPYSFYQNQTLGDPAQAKKTLGFAARWRFPEAVEDYLRWLR